MMGAYKILIVDDSNFIRLTIRKYLEEQRSAPVEVTEAFDGKRALEILAGHEFDLILTDLEMPNMTGLELIAELRRDVRFDSVPIIFLTSVDDSKTKVTAFECGATDYLIKPCISEELIARVMAHLERKFMTEAIEKKASVAENLTTFYRSMRSQHQEKLENEVITLLANLFHIGSVALWEFEASKNRLVLKKSSDELEIPSEPQIRGEGLMWKACASVSLSHLEGLKKEEVESLGFNSAAHSGSAITVLPLFWNENVLGVLNLTNFPQDFFFHYELTHLEAIQHYISNLFQNAQAYRYIQDKQLQTEQELEQAKATQTSILPQKLPDTPSVKFVVKYVSMEQIGGDLYDMIEFPDNRTGVFVADVTGHGIAAALISCMSVSLFRAVANGTLTVEQVLAQINRELYSRIPDGKFVTGIYCIYDPEQKQIDYCIGGHPEGYILRGTEVIPIGEEIGLPLGIFGDDIAEFVGASLKVEKGDLVVLYTDGIVEMASPSGEMYGNQRLKDFLSENHESPLDQILDQLYAHALAFSKRSSFDDDITLVAFEILT